jgi:hypothetical protein
MKTATGLTLMAIGAILAFAVTSHPHFVNLQVVGWVVMLTGVAGIFVPRRGYGWLRRRVVVRRPPRRAASSRAALTAAATGPAEAGDLSGADPQVMPADSDLPAGDAWPVSETIRELFED